MEENAGRRSSVSFLLAAAVCVAFVFLLVGLIIPEYRLSRAEQLIGAGDYDAAFALLAGMEYKNSAEIAADCLFRAQRAGLADAAVGSTVRFGLWEQDGDPSNGSEQIEWIVLAIEGDRALLISRYGLEAREFNDELNAYRVVTWSNSQLRTWLNDTFYRSAFSADHRRLILTTEVAASRNPVSDVDPGRDTKDEVFLLSIDEADRYFDSDGARQCRATASCSTKQMETGDDGSCYWWLRSPGMQPSSPAVVVARGSIFTNGFSCGHKPEIAVRPAMWITLGGS